jgi:Flp pilus assembly pilin Flp
MIQRYVAIKNRISEFGTKRDEGATMVEYGLIVAAIALVAVVGAAAFGDELSTFFDDLGNSL